MMIRNIIMILAAVVITMAAAIRDMVRDTPVYINGRHVAMGAALLVFVVPVVWAVATLF